MPGFAPFAGLRYDLEAIDMAAVASPPYDVIDGAERGELAARSPYNAVHVDVPVGGPDRYEQAAATFARWQDDGVVQADGPSLYVYRMSFSDEEGRSRQTVGVMGALALEPPGEGDVLPHEQTTPKAMTDRLELLRATRANLSAIWVLSLAEGLSKLIDPTGTPAVSFAADGVGHELWCVDDPAAIAAVVDAVQSAPVVIADGHHRYETCLAYAAEQTDLPGARATMACVVELAEDQLAVRAIHRLISGLPADFDFVAALSPWFDAVDVERGATADEGLLGRMSVAGALGLVHQHGTALLVPRAGAFAGVRDLDTARLDAALGGLPRHELTFQHGVDHVAAAVAGGRAQVGVLLRPVSVAQIAAVAHTRDRMPPKTTFFWPKLRTGLVFRPLELG
jgi:uncharacterized protein (DUF1015 family)